MFFCTSWQSWKNAKCRRAIFYVIENSVGTEWKMYAACPRSLVQFHIVSCYMKRTRLLGRTARCCFINEKYVNIKQEIEEINLKKYWLFPHLIIWWNVFFFSPPNFLLPLESSHSQENIEGSRGDSSLILHGEMNNDAYEYYIIDILLISFFPIYFQVILELHLSLVLV